MSTDRWHHLARIFDDARQLPIAARAEFVDQECGEDQALRRDALDLLAADETSGGFMAEAALDQLAQEVASEGWSFQPGERVGAYTIIRLLGSGGGGQVWRARDERLGRDVAIKVLLPHSSHDSDRVRRFADEARAVGALNHSNILTVYDLGEHRSIPFIVCECLDGQTLRQRLTAGPLPVDEVIAVTLGVAQGLAAAHARGILHRDLKPENTFIKSDGSVKILDFGLAKLQSALNSAAMAARQTITGVIVGTAGYMAPEQVKGEPVDVRTDLFALGVMMYEMLAGQHPYRKASTFETLHALITIDPPDPGTVNGRVPPALGAIIMRLLKKRPDSRFQSASDLAWTLQQMVNHQFVPPEGIDAIAVLPFENASGDPDAEYLSDGITEDLINRLAQLGGLRVLARSTVFRYKPRSTDAQQIGRELKVRSVLTGRVFHRGDTLVIGAELVDVANGWQLWGERYKRRLTDILDVQEEIARTITDKLRVKLTPTEERRLGKRSTVDPEAYQLYLKGLYFWNKWTAEGFRTAEDYFRQALLRDPNYAPAYAGIADIMASPPYMGLVSPRDAIPKAKAAVQKALALDESLPLAWFIDGITRMAYDWDMPAAQGAFERAIDVGPGDARGYSGLGYVLGVQGRLAEALKHAQRAAELEPLTPLWTANAGLIHRWMRNDSGARRELEKSLEVDAHFLLSRLELGRVHVAAGRLHDAVREFKRAVHDSDNHPLAIGHLGYAHALLAERGEAKKCLAKLRELGRYRYVLPSAAGLVYLGLGDHDRVFKALEEAFEERETRMIFLKVDPIYDPLRSDPRFEALLQRVGFVAGR